MILRNIPADPVQEVGFLNKIFKEIKIAISFGKDTNYLFNELILYYYFIEGFR